ncbi:MAG: NADH-quinone oxidoreductase subunit N [Deltaproteobacteria bacterium]|nr:NADH-quinone oxidoreductase subunit N [Deltaproteobacteria bacterium]
MQNAAQLIADNQGSFAYVLPEIVVIAGILGLFLLDLFLKKSTAARVIHTAAVVVVLLVATGLLFAMRAWEPASLFNGLLVHDAFAWFFRAFALLSTLVVIVMVPDYREIPTSRIGEFYALLLTIVLGLLLLPASTDLLMIVLSLELVSLVSYVLTGYRKGNRPSAEGALKYVIFGGVATGTMLYGFSILYGLCGGTSLVDLQAGFARAMGEVSTLGDPTAIKLALATATVFVLVGFGYKIAAAPFHLWTPDAYEGAPTPFTAFLSVGPKAAGLALMIRFFFGIFTSHDPAAWAAGTVQSLGSLPWMEILALMSMATMTVGNITALRQENVKRMLAFSSIAHAGTMLMGLATGTVLGVEAVIVYAIIYLFMNLGAFAIVSAIGTRLGTETVEGYRGLSQRAPWAAFTLAAFLFSLTGLPPLAGFIGKFYVFYAVILKGGSLMWILALVGALNGAISLFYYAKIVRAMYLEKAVDPTPVRIGWSTAALAGAMLIPTLVFGLYWSPLVDTSREAVREAPLSAQVSGSAVAAAEHDDPTKLARR